MLVVEIIDPAELPASKVTGPAELLEVELVRIDPVVIEPPATSVTAPPAPVVDVFIAPNTWTLFAEELMVKLKAPDVPVAPSALK